MALSGCGVDSAVGIGGHSIVSHVDVVMLLMSFHGFLTVFCQVRVLIFSLEILKQSEVSRSN